MIFDHGFYHADPHPGNLLVMDGYLIGLFDFGMVGRIDERLHEDIGEMLVALGQSRRRTPDVDDHAGGQDAAGPGPRGAEPRRDRFPLALRHASRSTSSTSAGR